MENLFMTTLIKKEGSAKQLQDCIDSLNVENFMSVISRLIDYNNRESLSDIEKDFVGQFISDASKIAEKFIEAFVEGKDSAFMLEFIKELEIEGTYSFSQHMDNEALDEYIEYYNLPSEKKLSILKEYMTDTLNEVVKERTQSKEEKQKERLEKEIARIKDQIKTHKENMKRKEKELAEAIARRG